MNRQGKDGTLTACTCTSLQEKYELSSEEDSGKCSNEGVGPKKCRIQWFRLLDEDLVK